MRPVYFAAARRTPIGKLHGSLSNVRPDDLAATVLRGLLADVQALDPARIDDVYWGAANQFGEDNRNVARMSVLLAGLPDTVPGATFNRLCGSGMEAVIIAARTIAADEADVVVAGGSDSMSRAPTNPSCERSIPTTHASAGDSPNPRMADLHGVLSMGETAEDVATRHGIPRDQQDTFALRSHQRAAAHRAGAFDAELLPVERADGVTVTADECIRENTSPQRLASLKPVFRADGTVTAGNASPMNDGAAALLLVSEQALADLDLDTAEINEAFAAQALACLQDLRIDPDQVNPDGGAIALGHPLGCPGSADRFRSRQIFVRAFSHASPDSSPAVGSPHLLRPGTNTSWRRRESRSRSTVAMV
ncbi:thiolase family protein [Nonomuraea sp. NPDC049269]|uniref:thiolase family protein n=1 Tax=Nonomuraea sp. NPDC049269 TaxID=3364349 RepID=UPI00371120C5